MDWPRTHVCRAHDAASSVTLNDIREVSTKNGLFGLFPVKDLIELSAVFGHAIQYQSSGGRT